MAYSSFFSSSTSMFANCSRTAHPSSSNLDKASASLRLNPPGLSLRAMATNFPISSSVDEDCVIGPDPVLNHSSLTLNSLHISEMTESSGIFLPISYCATVFCLTPIRSPNFAWVNPYFFLISFILSFIVATSFLYSYYISGCDKSQQKISQKQ